MFLLRHLSQWPCLSHEFFLCFPVCNLISPLCCFRTITGLSGISGIGFDLVRGTQTLDLIKGGFPSGKFLFAGVVDGRNIWANDLASSLSTLEALEAIVGKGIHTCI